MSEVQGSKAYRVVMGTEHTGDELIIDADNNTVKLPGRAEFVPYRQVRRMTLLVEDVETTVQITTFGDAGLTVYALEYGNSGGEPGGQVAGVWGADDEDAGGED